MIQIYEEVLLLIRGTLQIMNNLTSFASISSNGERIE